MRKLLLFLPLFFILTLGAQEKCQKYHKIRINYTHPDQLHLLHANGFPLENITHKKGVFIEGVFSENEIRFLNEHNYTYDYLIQDMQSYYANRNYASRNKKPAKTAVSIPENYNHGSMGGYLTHDEVMQELDDMFALYPDLITERQTIDTFKTHEDRSLYWLKISDNPNQDEDEPEVFYNALHHAREAISVQQLIFYMWYLLENYESSAEIKGLVDNTEMYFVPIVNPDGYIYNQSISPNGGGMWRKNRRNHGNGTYGVDPNRNYDYTDPVTGSVWGTSGISFNTSDDTYCGEAPFSEPENQAIKWFVENHEFRFAINNHSYSDLLLYPFGYEYNKPTPDHETFKVISELMVAENTMFNTISSDLYPASGVADDWMYGETDNHDKIFSFTPEIGKDVQGFWPEEFEIDSLCGTMLNLNLTTAHLAGDYAIAKDLSPKVIESKATYIKYELQRLGLNDTESFSVSIVPFSENATSSGVANIHENVNYMEVLIDSLPVELNDNIEAGDEVEFDITVMSQTFEATFRVKKIYGVLETVLAENCDTISKWNKESDWNTTEQVYYTPTSSITDSPTDFYSDYENSTISYIDTLDLAECFGVYLSFAAKWDIENDYDYVQFQVKAVDETDWISMTGSYTNLGSVYQDYEKPLYDGKQEDWIVETIDLSQFVGQKLNFRFKMVSDSYINGDGFYFDDIHVQKIMAPVIDHVPGFSNAFKLTQNHPNPAAGEFSISYNLAEENNCRLIILNALGQVVFNKQLNHNSATLILSADDFDAGMYTYFIQSDNSKSETLKMIIQ